MMEYSDIKCEVANNILTIKLNRPDSLNAWTRLMEKELRDAMNNAARSSDIRVIVLTGEGRGFCAGADMSLLNDVRESDSEVAQRPENTNFKAIENSLDLPADFSLGYSYFPSVPKPIIAAINGPCAGLGLIMAMYSDIRFSSASAKFTTAFSRRGLIAEHGISWMLPKIVGFSGALELLISGRKFDAEECLRLGFITDIFPDDRFFEKIYDYAEDLAKNVSPRSIRVMKEQLYKAQFQDLNSAIEKANLEMLGSFESEDFSEGVAHFVEKRAAKFSGK